MAKVSVLPSVSEPDNVIVFASSSFVDTDCAAAVGAVLPLNVTVSDGLPPRTAVHGFVRSGVASEHVEELRLAAPLQPAKTDPAAGVALNVTVAPLSEMVMFGKHVLPTV